MPMAQARAAGGRWRQVWSDHRLKGVPPREVMRQAHEHAFVVPAEAGAQGS